jgi:isopentenyl-diphosphate delta-isomerase
MGISCDLYFSFSFLYKASFENGLIENELDHVFIGFSDDKPMFNPSEVCNYRYIYSEQLLKEIKDSPEQFTPWFKICLNKVLESQYYLQKNALIA